MIINNRKDLDAAPSAERERFMLHLSSTIHKWRWNGSDWEQYENTDSIERFGFTLDDFPDAPVPPKPDHDPEKKQTKQRIEEIQQQLKEIDREYGPRGYRDAVIEGQIQVHEKQVEYAREGEDKASPLREEKKDLESKLGEYS